MDRECDVARVTGGKHRTRSLDGAAADVARRQYGRISRSQLLELGFGPDAIEHRLRHDRLHVVHRGVYAVGYLGATQEGIWIAAVLAGGPEAVPSHWSAAALWRLHGSGGPIADVTLPTERRRPGIRFHRAVLPADEVTTHEGITVATPPRTLFDTSADLSRRRLERAMNEAHVLRVRDRLSLEHMLERHPRHRGARTVRAALAARRAGETVTRSELERLFVEFLDETAMLRPELNACSTSATRSSRSTRCGARSGWCSSSTAAPSTTCPWRSRTIAAATGCWPPAVGDRCA